VAERAQCKYFEACELLEDTRVGDDLYCVLHLPPGPAKDVQKFGQVVADYLAKGRSDFRWVYFPTESPSFQGRRFQEAVDFRGASFGGMLNLTDTTFDRGVFLGGPEFRNVDLSRARVRGPLRVEGRISNTLRLHQAVLENLAEVRVDDRIHVQAYAARFDGKLSVHAQVIGSLELQDASLRHGLSLRGRYESTPGVRFERARIEGDLDFRECDLDLHLAFNEAVFDPNSTLDLEGARVHGTFVLAGLPVIPGKIRLNGARFDQAASIEAALGAQRSRIIAAEKRPLFGGPVTLTNVDLRECLLVGNAVGRIEFWNVEWPRRRGRYTLRDENVYRHTGGIPPSNLREAYQVLKQKYHDKGDHVRAGDFHYGEMEMKRREYGWPRRYISPEFLYWLFSGYGMGYVRAFLWLVALLVGCGLLYWRRSPAAFPEGIQEAMRFSLSVAAFQRPEVPKEFGALPRWVHIAEVVLSPVIAALFVLALRMRLKR